MARIVTYTMVMAGVWMLLFMAGLHTGSSALLGAFGINNGNITFVSFALAVVALFAVSAVTGNIIVGLFTRQAQESSLIATGVAPVLLTLTFVDFSSICSYMFGVCAAGSDCNFAAWLISTIFIVLWAGYLISIIQWWRGNDL